MSRLLRLFLVVSLRTAFMCVAAPVVPRSASLDAWFRRVVQNWARSILWAAGIDVSVSSEDIDKFTTGGSSVLVSNHQSNIDSVILLAIMPPEAHPCFAAKKVLFRIPFFGAALRRIGSVEVDRAQGARAMLKLREEFIGAGDTKSLILFPEGTRSRKGELTPFKKGAFVLARDANVRLLPVFLSGTAEVMPPGKVLPLPGRVRIEVADPVAAESIRDAGVVKCMQAISEMMRRGYAA